MDNREIIRLLAEKVMGWTLVPCEYGQPEDMDVFRAMEGSPSNKRHARYWPGCRGGSGDNGGQWNPLDSIADAYEMEGRISEELRPRYILELAEIAIATNDPYGRKWSMVHAWPEERCNAAVAALKAGGRQ